MKNKLSYLLNSKFFILVVGGVIYVLAIYIMARFSLRGLGGEVNFSRALTVSLFLAFLIPAKISFWAIVFPLSLLVMLYCPIGSIYGQPDYQALASLLATNYIETTEFLSQIPIKVFFKSALIPLLALLSFFIARKFAFKPWRNQVIVLSTVTVLTINLKPTDFFNNVFLTAKETKEQLDELNKYVNNSAWKDSILISKPKDYVLIIGESARRDYFHVYGYPVTDTPFFDSVPAIIVDGLTAGGTYTIASLTNMLTMADTVAWKPKYDLNFIDLAKSAGIKTYWLSNQGYVGQYDTPVTSIANRSDQSFFLNNSEFGKANLSDNMLLPEFNKALNEHAEGSRLFVLHTIGSHYNACRRLYDFKKEAYESSDPYYDYLACYVSTIKKADRFAEQVFQILKAQEVKTKRPFSLIYFADHGQIHNKDSGVMKLDNNHASKFHYDIPLIRIDSDYVNRKIFKSAKSGLRFTEGLANWMGIKNPRIANYDLFDGQADPNDYGLKDKIKAIDNAPDPAINISPYVDR